MSSKAPIDVDPDPPSGLGCLVAAIFLQETDIPADVSSHLPAETTSVSALLRSDIPDRLSDTSIIKPAHLSFVPV